MTVWRRTLLVRNSFLLLVMAMGIKRSLSFPQALYLFVAGALRRLRECPEFQLLWRLLLISMIRSICLGPLYIRAQFLGPLQCHKYRPMGVPSWSNWAVTWAKRLKIEARPNFPISYMASYMAELCWERIGPIPKTWVAMGWRPNSPTWAQLCTCISTVRFNQSRSHMSKLKSKIILDL